jgi:hypothetical protein
MERLTWPTVNEHMVKPSRTLAVDPTARTVFEALERLGWKADPHALAQKIEDLARGLPAEDEFAALLTWMGRCELVHKLDQEQHPAHTRDHWKIPDLLAVFRIGDSPQACLIEVKSGKMKQLAWTQKYFDGLRRYADQVGLPLLVAWRMWPGGVWSLFEARHFRKVGKRWRVEFRTAMRETLMSSLVGDFAVVMRSGVGLHLVLDKEHSQRSPKGERFIGVIREAYFTDGENQRTNRLGPGLFSLFACSDIEQRHQEESKGTLRLSFVVPQEPAMEWAHRMLRSLLALRSPKSADIPHWRSVVSEEKFPIQFEVLEQAARDGIERKIVRNVFYIKPNTPPAFSLADDAANP